jgi:hypothetical protein
MRIMAEAEIERLLREASAAHAVYEKETLGGVRDEHWALWYAGHMLEHGVGAVEGWPAAARTQEALEALLLMADESHRANAPHEDWPEYYARYILGGEGRT